MDKTNHFIFGAQYYRKPTPERSQWDSDLKNMRALGMRDVKFWVQWRGNHIGEDQYDFSDIDELMDLALKHDLRVTLNVIFDITPAWLLKKYPDCVQVTADGQPVIPFAPGHRQLGGFPGACYNHPECRLEREKFLRAVTRRYRHHPAMYMWDIWNEPEQCGKYRNPKVEKLACYCDKCRSKFLQWLEAKYGSLDELNRVWGKCYGTFDEVELPRDIYTLKDFIDFRQFQSEVMTQEANMRIQTVKDIDQEHPVYLHVVPNTSHIFNAITGVNDFDMARNCDVFASTNFASPIWSILTLSAGSGKRCYNVECHIGSGSIRMHQKQISYRDLVKDFAAQIGSGIRGFMFWQYRPEILGHEAPAWGMANLDGSIGSVGRAAQRFSEKVASIERYLQLPAQNKAQIAVWKGFENEVFQFASQVSLSAFSETITSYVNALYSNNYSCIIADDEMILNGLEGIRLLIMPLPYCISEKLYRAVCRFVENGGVLLTEAHFGGFNSDTGRHEYAMPGFGAADAWGIRETETTSSYHLKLGAGKELSMNGFSDDVKKAISEYGLDGGLYFPVTLQDGSTLAGCNRVAFLQAEDAEVMGRAGDAPIILAQRLGEGAIIYAGTNLGEGAKLDKASFERFVVQMATRAHVEPNMGIHAKQVHIEQISDELVMVNNQSHEPFVMQGRYQSVFFDTQSEGNSFIVPAESADILRCCRDD